MASFAGWHEVQGRRGRADGRHASYRAATTVDSHLGNLSHSNESQSVTNAKVTSGTESLSCEDPQGDSGVGQLEAPSIEQACVAVGLSAAPSSLEACMNSASGCSGAFHGSGDWQVVVDRTFIDVFVPGASEEEATSPRCKSAPGDLGLYSVFERVASECTLSACASPRHLREDASQLGASCRGSDDSMPPLIQDGLPETTDCEPQRSNNDALDDSDEGVEVGDATNDDSGSMEALWRLLQERDEEIRQLKKAVESAQEVAKALGRNAQEAKAEKEVRALRQRNAMLEKHLSKHESELKKRTSEVSELQDALAMKEAEVAEKDARLKEVENPNQKVAAKLLLELAMHDKSINIVARHALEAAELTVTVPSDATFRDVKKAIAIKVGSDDILAKGRLLKAQRGTYSAHQDKAKVGNIREVLVLGVDLELPASQGTIPSQVQEGPNSKTNEAFEARITELEALVAKKDRVLRGVLGEMKRLREEQSQAQDESKNQKERADSSATVITRINSSQRPPLPVVDVAKLAKERASIESKKSNQQFPSSVMDVAERPTEYQAKLPPKSTMWKALVASRAKLNLNKSESSPVASSETSSSSMPKDDQPWSLSQFLRSQGIEEEMRPATDKTLDKSSEASEVAFSKHWQPDHAATPESLEREVNKNDLGIDQDLIQSDVESKPRSQFSISSFVREHFSSDAQKCQTKAGLALISGKPLLSKFVSAHNNSGVSNAETLTVSSCDDLMISQGSELDSDIDFAPTVSSSKDDHDDSVAEDFVIGDDTQGYEDLSHISKDLDACTEKDAVDKRPRNCTIRFDSKIAARVARKDAQTRARELAMASTASASLPSGSPGSMPQARGIPISAGMKPKWRLNNSMDIGL